MAGRNGGSPDPALMVWSPLRLPPFSNRHRGRHQCSCALCGPATAGRGCARDGALSNGGGAPGLCGTSAAAAPARLPVCPCSCATWGAANGDSQSAAQKGARERGDSIAAALWGQGGGAQARSIGARGGTTTEACGSGTAALQVRSDAGARPGQRPGRVNRVCNGGVPGRAYLVE